MTKLSMNTEGTNTKLIKSSNEQQDRYKKLQ